MPKKEKKYNTFEAAKPKSYVKQETDEKATETDGKIDVAIELNELKVTKSPLIVGGSTREKHIIGYATGVFDLFHVGHLNILKVAKENCDFLIAGVSTDCLVKEYKGKDPIIPFEERMEIVSAVKYVDVVVPQINMNKMEAWIKYRFNRIFLGEDWKKTEIWKKWEQKFQPLGVEIVYVEKKFTTTSSAIRDMILKE